MAPNRALIIVNKGARQGGSDLSSVQNLFNQAGIEPIVHEFEDVTHIDAVVQKHHGRVNRIVVGGGDGTLNAALEPVLSAELPLGILPLGTANDLARTLQIPFDPREAARIIIKGHTTTIDLGRVNGTYFFNVANIGLAAKVSHTLSAEKKKRWGVLAYPLALINAYRGNRPFRAHVTCDGQSLRMKSIQIAIGNGRHYGGGLAIRHDAEIDDHQLNFYSLHPQSFWQLIKAGPAIVKGTFTTGKFIHLMNGREIRVATDRTKPVDVDGELITHTPATFRVEKSALSVFIP